MQNSTTPTYLVIFGAAVREDGSPSGSLSRRVQGALALAEHLDNPIYLPTGGVGKYPPAESEVMSRLLIKAGVPTERIIQENQADDTLSSALNCNRLLQGLPPGELLVCSSTYHNPRCTVLMRMLGWRARWGAMPGDLAHLGFVKWAWYYIREIPAIAWDIFLLWRQLRSPQSNS